MYQKITIVGRAGQDPELRHTSSGNSVCNVSVACSESFKDKSGQKQEKTEWFRVVAWGKLADIMGQYVSKGMLVLIEGRMSTRKWQDQQGNDRYSTDLVASTMKMLDKKDSPKAPVNTNTNIIDDDIPF